jgi:Thioredoxin
MTQRLILAAAIVVLAAGVSMVLRRRQGRDAPSQPRSWTVPAQVDRSDFARPDAPWLVVTFTSATCSTCAQIVAKSAVLASGEVAVDDVEYSARTETHRRYSIDAVPTILIVDGDGVVQRSFVGPVSATDLWAAVAEARAPGTSPEPDLGR